MESISRLDEITTILRSENGCPWDREQTHSSITGDLIEETYEVIDSIQKNDFQNLREELGDLLFQIVFHAKIAEENKLFTLDDVASDVNEKLIRRHPHVFAEKNGDITTGEVLENWEKIKQTEKNKPETKSFLDSVPASFPALLQALKLQSKAAKKGFDWDNPEDIELKLEEEIGEFRDELHAYRENPSDEIKNRLEDEFGDLLFTLVNIGRSLKISPEGSLNKTNRKFRERFSFMEKEAAGNQKNLEELDLNELDRLWEMSKGK